jgi:hypothetical protein
MEILEKIYVTLYNSLGIMTDPLIFVWSFLIMFYVSHYAICMYEYLRRYIKLKINTYWINK